MPKSPDCILRRIFGTFVQFVLVWIVRVAHAAFPAFIVTCGARVAAAIALIYPSVVVVVASVAALLVALVRAETAVFSAIAGTVVIAGTLLAAT